MLLGTQPSSKVRITWYPFCSLQYTNLVQTNTASRPLVYIHSLPLLVRMRRQHRYTDANCNADSIDLHPLRLRYTPSCTQQAPIPWYATRRPAHIHIYLADMLSRHFILPLPAISSTGMPCLYLFFLNCADRIRRCLQPHFVRAIDRAGRTMTKSNDGGVKIEHRWRVARMDGWAV